jgi:hypothetical protein|tara:strand:- start:745 stop:966 length:222 start_codon:yes stop_codon:yes gene_type:complete
MKEWNCTIDEKYSIHVSKRYDNAKEMIRFRYLTDDLVTLDVGHPNDWLTVFLDAENATRLLEELTNAIEGETE